jgi:hypothetical protein
MGNMRLCEGLGHDTQEDGLIRAVGAVVEMETSLCQ